MGRLLGQDHHIWLTTEYDELVDLSISHCHRHPRSRRTDGIPMPPLWWNDLGQWPPVIRYLPDAPVRIRLQGEDAADLARLEREVMTALDARLVIGSFRTRHSLASFATSTG